MDGGPYSFRGTERFQLISLIGHGGMGVVYAAFDTVNAAAEALKLLPLASPDSLLRFKREVRSVADIRHPNLVRLGELVAHEAQWFFTMELVDGVDLISYVRGHDAPAAQPAPVVLSPGPGVSTAVGPTAIADPPSAPVDGGNARLRPALAPLAQGLIALHEAGCVHRGVKPSHMLLARARRGPLALDPAEVRATMFTAFRELMAAMARRAPIVAFVDDLQWADRDSAALLSDLLAAREDAPRVLLIGTLRTVGADEPEHLFSPTTNEQHLLLANLDPETARTLARELLRTSGGPTGEEEAARLVHESAGHPLFLRELVRTARTATDDGAPATLEGVLRARIGELPPAAIRLLRVLAIAGAPVALRRVRRAAELDGPETARLMDELRAARLVHSGSDGGDDVVVIAHDRVRQAVMGAMTSAGEAKAVHACLAEAFEDAGDVLGAGEHWREAGAPERAAVHFATAARQAAAALAFDRAASL